MRVLILYRPHSEHSRMIEEFIHEFELIGTSSQLEVLSLETREGSSMASLYDIMQYPAILVLQGDGLVQKAWQGDQLPRMDEVISYARA